MSSHIYDEEKFITSNWIRRAWSVCGCTTLLITLVKFISLAPSSTYSWLHFGLAAVIGYLLADLSSGFYHWGCDNYGTFDFPIMGIQLEGFIFHHYKPSEIAKIPISNHHFGVSPLVVFTVMPINLMYNDPLLLVFVFVLAGLNLFGFQIHAWAHTQRRDIPWLIAALQDAGVFIAPQHHALHHRPPYNCNYCTLSGWWNRLLNGTDFFLKLEKLIFLVSGVRARNWDVKPDTSIKAN